LGLHHVRVHYVTESGVDLHRHTCPTEKCAETDAHTLVVGVFLDTHRCNGIGIEDETVIRNFEPRR